MAATASAAVSTSRLTNMTFGVAAEQAPSLMEGVVTTGGGLSEDVGRQAGRSITRDVISEARQVGKQGNFKNTRHVKDDAELQSIFKSFFRRRRFSEGGDLINASNYDGTMAKLKDGTIVGLRSTSKSGGLTIDLRNGNRNVIIHIE